MKGIIAVVSMAFLSAHAAEGPQVYGIINKEYRHVDQDDLAARQSSTGITDVDGFETRLGAKGTHDLKDGLKAHYKIELGINSQRDLVSPTHSDERIRIRLAKADVEGNFGTVTVGQDWIPNTLRMLALDPLTATGAQLLGLESGNVKGAVAGNFGMKARYFKDQIGYASPSFSGAKIYITADRDATSVDNSSATSNWYTSMVTYDQDFGGVKLNSHFTYAFEDQRLTNSEDHESFMTLGAKISASGFALGLAYTIDNLARTGTPAKDVERKHMLATASYDMGDLTFALNYGNTQFDSDETAITGTTGGEQTQIAYGVIYKLSKDVKTRLLHRHQSIEGKTGAIFGTKKDNKADAFIAGLTVMF